MTIYPKIEALLLFVVLPFTASVGHSQITLECDFACSKDKRETMHYHWNISNRISPIKGFRMPVGEKPCINVVRPLGGKSKDGKKVIAEDTYKWDGSRYIYDWAPLKRQIDNVQAQAELYQLLIDNPPWAFQRGVDLKGADPVETYGNAWPPNDPETWHRYIQAMLKELIRTYGKETVEQWRYCIGREVGTSGHWKAGKIEFFEHYKNTEKAIHSIVPKAEVGTHFLWASSKNSFGPDFVKWCKQHNVRYDFLGVSYYPFHNRINRVDMEHVYAVDFAPIKDIPEWNSSATLEIHEFALIIKMSKKGNSFENASNAHVNSFTAMLAKMMYEHDIFDVYRWGTGENKLAEQIFLGMKGNIYYTSSKKGQPSSKGNMVDAVFARDESTGQINIVAYNYNANPRAKEDESVRVVSNLPRPTGTSIKYRNAIYIDNTMKWSEWRTTRTIRGDKPGESKLELTIKIPPFSFQKIELI